VLDSCGAIPIPPYLRRAAEPDDAERYQTVYARCSGSVAAPTAGLHFTEKVLQRIAQKGIAKTEITLHIGAGTFRPVKSETIAGHAMHSEPFSISKESVGQLLTHLDMIVAVGTTSARTLESLYWLGCQCLQGKNPERVGQWEVYQSAIEERQAITAQQALEALLSYMEKNKLQVFHAATQLIIAPPYRYRIVRGLITNFHQF
jgi:S-adenosylmethionine:tRNA ribosyltransferase-isomerase